ncbi:MAG: DUF1092 family protein [Spirulinaceae cyanobacterium SM2_1_0]|nr:DUF1092 family protein [Spirulinaceae cyanobacterium SM2_1_0]
MHIWQADFYKRTQPNAQGELVWSLLICDADGNTICEAECPQSAASSEWLTEQLQTALRQHPRPEQLQAFRPQSVNLLAIAAEKLDLAVEPTRHTPALKQALETRAVTAVLEKPPPRPLPDNLWGETWRFAALPAGELTAFRDRPLPVLDWPPDLDLLTSGLAFDLPIPGLIVYGGRRSLQLVQWLTAVRPVALNYIPTNDRRAGGLVLEAGLVERWVLLTFEDPEVARAAKNFHQRLQASHGLHFLLVQPDDSGMTYTGFWLLRQEAASELAG